MAVNSILLSKTFDNGVICVSEQSVQVVASVYKAVRDELIKRGAYILNEKEADKVRGVIFKNASINPEIVGQTAFKIAEIAGFKVPEKVYFKYGCLPVALSELKEMDKKKVFIVTDKILFDLGYADKVTNLLEEYGIAYKIFTDVHPDPTLQSARRGVKEMEEFEPDVIIGLGGGSAMDAAKIMQVLYEYPDIVFEELAMRFVDIRKRVYGFPKLGKKTMIICISTTAGTGSEVTPFTIITDEDNGVKYALADYELLSDMAIVDAEFMMNIPKGLTAASGIDAVTHAIESYVSILATDFTDGLALQALKIIFEYLPLAYNEGTTNIEAREKMGHAASIAAMDFGNAFLGIYHSLAQLICQIVLVSLDMIRISILNPWKRFPIKHLMISVLELILDILQ